jgi:hypothetical protein
MKIRIPAEIVEYIIEKDCDYKSSAIIDDDYDYTKEICDKVVEQLRQPKDAKGRLTLTSDVAEFVIGKLCWYTAEYINAEAGE